MKGVSFLRFFVLSFAFAISPAPPHVDNATINLVAEHTVVIY